MRKNLLVGLTTVAAMFAFAVTASTAEAQKKFEVCDDGFDNDDDKLIDCDDPDCANACEPPSEICNDGQDNDGDKLVDCDDPDCAESCKEEPTGCSPGYYKNHLQDWVGLCCDTDTDPTCAEILARLTCKGSDASCGRSSAAAFLDACTGCSE